jgi:hypothetical protein
MERKNGRKMENRDLYKKKPYLYTQKLATYISIKSGGVKLVLWAQRNNDLPFSSELYIINLR